MERTEWRSGEAQSRHRSRVFRAERRTIDEIARDSAYRLFSKKVQSLEQSIFTYERKDLPIRDLVFWSDITN